MGAFSKLIKVLGGGRIWLESVEERKNIPGIVKDGHAGGSVSVMPLFVDNDQPEKYFM